MNPLKAKRILSDLQSNDLKSLCRECGHRKTCVVPCKPVEIILSKNNRNVRERRLSDCIIVDPDYRSKSYNCTEIFRSEDESNRDDALEIAFSDINTSPFTAFNPKFKQSKIFIERFFYRVEFVDIAMRYEISVGGARSMYASALKKIWEILKSLDRLEKLDRFISFDGPRQFKKSQRWFLLNRLFGLRPAEIVKFENIEGKHAIDLVKNKIKRVTDQVISGEIAFLNPTDEDRGDAEKRILKQRRFVRNSVKTII